MPMMRLFAILVLLVGALTANAQKDFSGYVFIQDTVPLPRFQAFVVVKQTGKTDSLIIRTYFDGSYKFPTEKEKTYTVHIYTPGYKDTTFTVSTDKKGNVTPGSLKVVLIRDGMRLLGTLINKQTGLPVPDAIILARNIMTRQTQKITTNKYGDYNFKLEYETNYKVWIDKYSPGIANKLQDTTFYISTVGFNMPLDFRLDIALGESVEQVIRRLGYNPYGTLNQDLKPAVQVMGKADSALLAQNAAKEEKKEKPRKQVEGGGMAQADVPEVKQKEEPKVKTSELSKKMLEEDMMKREKAEEKKRIQQEIEKQKLAEIERKKSEDIEEARMADKLRKKQAEEERRKKEDLAKVESKIVITPAKPNPTPAKPAPEYAPARAGRYVRLDGDVMMEGTESPVVGAKVTITNTSNASAFNLTTDKLGRYIADLNPELTYAISINADGLKSKTDTLYPVTDEKKIVVYLNHFVTEFVPDIPSNFLPSVNFKRNSSEITSEASIQLRLIATYLSQHPELKLNLYALVSSDESAGKTLSEKRLANVQRTLVQNGLPESRLRGYSYNRSTAINECSPGVKCSEEKLNENRCVLYEVTNK
jgi:outer membrane protein OmpA-like peptidoglycan-associated protein